MLKFDTMETVFDYVKNGEKPIRIVVLGTTWSPPCKYTMQRLKELSAESEYSDLIQPFFVDQDKEVQFCLSENIPIGFPTILVFVNKFLVPFVGPGQSFDPSKKDQKNRLVRQLSIDQLRAIADGAIDVMNEKKSDIQTD